MKYNTCFNMDDPWKHDTKWKKPDPKAIYFMIQLYEIPRIGESIETEK